MKEENSEPSSHKEAVFELPGEPAMVINGVPKLSPNDTGLSISNSVDVEQHGNSGFGEWLEGREVRKLFGDEYYSGTVTEFEKETGWYRVVYEDGDFEDLEWDELEAVLLPMDITVPLKALALKTLRRNRKIIPKSGKKMARTRYKGSNRKRVASE